MKLTKLLSIALVLLIFPAGTLIKAGTFPTVIAFSDIPAKTIVIKHPAAVNIDGFFSSTTYLMFEVYKVGSTEDLEKIIASFKKNSNVENCEKGPLTGDFQGIALTLKSAKDKQWFGELFKKAGLNTIKINNNPVVKVDKL